MDVDTENHIVANMASLVGLSLDDALQCHIFTLVLSGHELTSADYAEALLDKIVDFYPKGHPLEPLRARAYQHLLGSFERSLTRLRKEIADANLSS